MNFTPSGLRLYPFWSKILPTNQSLFSPSITENSWLKNYQKKKCPAIPKQLFSKCCLSHFSGKFAPTLTSV